MGTTQCMISHKYKCCPSENNENVETNDDNYNSRQIVNRLPVIEQTEEVKQDSECYFAITLPSDIRKIEYNPIILSYFNQSSNFIPISYLI